MAHSHTHVSKAQAGFAYAAACAVGLVAVIIQTRGIYASHSSSLLADTFHLGADLWFNVASGVALFYKQKADRPGRVPGIMLVVTGAGSILLGIYRLLSDPHLQSPDQMLHAAGIGLLLNLFMFYILYRFAGGGHTHDHGHEHHDSNMKHLFADTVSSAAVTAAAATFVFWPAVTGLQYADPVLSVIIGVWLAHEGLKKIRN